MVSSRFVQTRARHEQANRAALAAVFGDMADDILARHDTGATVLLASRWDQVLADVMFDRNRQTATDIGTRVAALLRAGFDPAIMDNWLENNATIAAEQINTSTRDALAGLDRDGVVNQLDILQGSRLAQIAVGMVATAAYFGAHDAARAAGVRLKRWRTTSTNPRTSHASLNGQTVPLGSTFTNGMRWPGDGAGASGADDVANCQCVLEFVPRSG